MPSLPVPEVPERYFETVAEVVAKDPVAFVRAFSSTTWGPVTDAVKKGRLPQLVEVANGLLDRMEATEDIEIDFRWLSIDRMDPFTLGLALDGVVPVDRLMDVVVSGDDQTGPHGEPVIRLAIEEFGLDGAGDFLMGVRAFHLLQEEIDEDLGRERALKLLQKPLQKGMTVQEVDLFFRDDFEESEEELKTKTKTHRTWTGQSKKQEREIQSLRLTFEGGRVVGWDDKRASVTDATRPENIRPKDGVWGTSLVLFQAVVATLWMCEQGGMSEDDRADVLEAMLAYGREDDRFQLWRLASSSDLRRPTYQRFLTLMNGAMLDLPADELIDRCTDWAKQERDGTLRARPEPEETAPTSGALVPASAESLGDPKGCLPRFLAKLLGASGSG